MKRSPIRLHNFAKIRFVVPALLLAPLLAASALRSFGYLSDDIYWLQENLGGDKIVHCMMGAALMASSIIVVFPRSLRSIGPLLLAVFLLLALDELSQVLSKTRELDFFDLAAGCTGALLLAAVFITGMHLLGAMAQHRATCHEPAAAE